MSEMVKEWLKELYSSAIEETKAAISNERIWANGSLTDSDAQMHIDNIEPMEEYIEILTDLKNNL